MLAAMASRDAFGPRMRRAREQCGLSIDAIADQTKVPAALWRGMEQNDFSRWPAGIFARAYVREYAQAVGLDPDEMVEDFCRYFSIGDRRVARVIREQAALIGAAAQYRDELLPRDGDRRVGAADPVPASLRAVLVNPRRQRMLGAAIDVAAVALAGLAASSMSSRGAWIVMAVAGLAYHATGVIVAGRSPGLILVEALRAKLPFPLADERPRSEQLEYRGT